MLKSPRAAIAIPACGVGNFRVRRFNSRVRRLEFLSF